MTKAKNVSVSEALAMAADPPSTDDLTIMPVYELVARRLLEIANNPDPQVRGSMARATKAQRMFLDRQIGKRRSGTNPAIKVEVKVQLADLTAVPEVEE